MLCVCVSLITHVYNVKLHVLARSLATSLPDAYVLALLALSLTSIRRHPHAHVLLRLHIFPLTSSCPAPFNAPQIAPYCAALAYSSPTKSLPPHPSTASAKLTDAVNPGCVSPVRPLLVQHAVAAVTAADGLAALELHVAVAVAARVGDGARVDVDGGGVGGLGCLGLVAGHV